MVNHLYALIYRLNESPSEKEGKFAESGARSQERRLPQ